MRLPALKDLSSRQQEISDRITARRGATRGPFLVWLRSPELCERVEALDAYCRFESGLDPRIRELSLLIAAAVSTRSTPGTRTWVVTGRLGSGAGWRRARRRTCGASPRSR